MSRRFFARLLLIATLGVVFPLNAEAAIVLFANLTKDQETITGPSLTSTGDLRPDAFGTATFLLNDAQTELTFTATIFNIDVTGTQTPDTFDNLSAAHIHAPAPPGIIAGVRWGFFGIPDNDISPNDLVLTPFATGVGGTFSSKWDALEGNGGTTLAAQLPSILAGLSYINFHTTQFPGGEIRGQIIPAPEPTTLAIWGLGALGCGLAYRRSKRAA
jgi:hypothetical protein